MKDESVNDTQGTSGKKPCHPDAIHDRYPPLGTKEHNELHGLEPVKRPTP